MNNLPKYSQLSAINKILAKDLDNDGYKDIIVSGNMYNSEVETPRNDASVDLLMNYTKKRMVFKLFHQRKVGFLLKVMSKTWSL